MKGIMVYSSRTGNTKRMAEWIYRHLSKQFALDIFNIKDIKFQDINQYDYALFGAWVDRGKPDKKTLKLMEKVTIPMGIFVTLGAMPDSPHGREVAANIDGILSTRVSLGKALCPGTADMSVIGTMLKIPDFIIPKATKEKMVIVSENSREATPEELDEAADVFHRALEKFEA